MCFPSSFGYKIKQKYSNVKTGESHKSQKKSWKFVYILTKQFNLTNFDIFIF